MPEREIDKTDVAESLEKGKDAEFEQAIAGARETSERLQEAWEQGDPSQITRLKGLEEMFLGVVRYVRICHDHLAEHQGELDEEFYRYALELLSKETEKINQFLDNLEVKKAA